MTNNQRKELAAINRTPVFAAAKNQILEDLPVSAPGTPSDVGQAALDGKFVEGVRYTLKQFAYLSLPAKELEPVESDELNYED